MAVAHGATRGSKGSRARAAWQDIQLVWRVLRALVAGLDLGGMGPLVARALDPRRMALVKREVSEYMGSTFRSTSDGLTATSS